jgi:hypothetical protein
MNKTKGFPVHLDVCIDCGESVGIVLGRRLGVPLRKQDGEPIKEHEQVSTGQRCDECQGIKDEQIKIVEAGGVWMKCLDCGANGAIRADHPICGVIREKMGIQPPNPVGLEVTKENCPVCGDESDENS